MKKKNSRIGSEQRLKEFMKDANFDIHMSGKKIRSIGLTWGEGKRLSKRYGREEQISLINFLNRHHNVVRRFILK